MLGTSLSRRPCLSHARSTGLVMTPPFRLLGEKVTPLSVSPSWRIANLATSNGLASVDSSRCVRHVTRISEDPQVARESSRRRPLAVPRAPRTTVTGSYPARVRKVAASHGVWCSSAHAEVGSDSYRGCLPRLRGVLGLPRPLDAFLRPSPFRPSFMPVAPLSFALPEVFPLR